MAESLEGERYKQIATYKDCRGLNECSSPSLGEGYAGVVRKVF